MSPAFSREVPLAVPTAVFATMRPHAGLAEPLDRRPLLGTTQFDIEGSHAEVRVVLGMEIDGKLLLI